MKSILFNIQNSVADYANIMSKISKVDVEVMDANYFRVAGTGIFENQVNADMSKEGFVYTKVLQTGQRSIVTEPGNDALCFECPHRANCNETFEISMPIILRDKAIGVLGMMSSDIEQRERLAENLPMYLELLEKISDFISAKAFEYIEAKEINATLQALDCVTTKMEQGVIIVGKNGLLTTINESAIKQLEILSDPLQMEISIYSTGDIIEGGTEYCIGIGGRSITVTGELTILDSDNDDFQKILVFSNLSTLKDRINTSSLAINPLAVESIAGVSDSTTRLRREILKVAKSTSTVFITGESGTGKEMVATAIWKASDRSNQRFVAVNCGAIPEPLLESELFGYVKGAFTGADSKGRIGKFELANNGIIFLDEIGDMPLYLQVKLLRVLQERKIVRIGSNQVIPLNIRVIAATNKNLINLMAEKKFREDLYYRLNVIPINIEPLRKRREDIETLTRIFIGRYEAVTGKRCSTIQEDVWDKLLAYPWPGNVRELENVVEFMINMMEESGILDISTLPMGIQNYSMAQQRASDIISIEQLEKQEIEKALTLFGTSTEGKKMAAQALGLGIATLYRKLEKYKLN